MLKIKADKMNDLEKFGFEREDSAYRHKCGLLIPDWENDMPADRKVTLQMHAYQCDAIENMFDSVYRLITANM